MGVTDITFIIFSLNQIKDFEYQTVSCNSLGMNSHLQGYVIWDGLVNFSLCKDRCGHDPKKQK